MDMIRRSLKRVAIETLGWLLVAVGIAALVLPGPGLLMLFAGLALLATQYDWAERRLKPVREAALRTAADGVRSPAKIILSVSFTIALAGLGVLWILQPPVPEWWFLPQKLWLFGGWGTGVTLVVSALIALGMLVYSWFAFRQNKS